MSSGHSGATIPAEIAANLREFFPEFGDLNHEELLQHQECVYQSLKGYEMNRGKAPISSHVSNMDQFSGSGSSRNVCFNQLELDEAFARSLQMEDNFDGVATSHVHTSLSSSSSNSFNSATSRDVGDVTPRETPHTITSHEHDDVDPDNMSYEQLQSLGEAVGSESRGLPEEVIARLPSSKYKTGMFFRKKNKQECVICCMPFENGDKLISLSCSHQYHSKCIKRWLQEKKEDFSRMHPRFSLDTKHENCPVCQTEVSPE